MRPLIIKLPNRANRNNTADSHFIRYLVKFRSSAHTFCVYFHSKFFMTDLRFANDGDDDDDEQIHIIKSLFRFHALIKWFNRVCVCACEHFVKCDPING